MGRKKIEVLEWSKATEVRNLLSEDTAVYDGDHTRTLEGTVITEFGSVHVIAMRYPLRCTVVDGVRRKTVVMYNAFTRLTFVYCQGSGYPSRTYIQEHRGRFYSRRYCTTLAKRWAKAIAS